MATGDLPLRGLRVVDCSSGEAGPRATGLLADYGAEVVWIEPPGGSPDRTDRPIAHAVWNRGKRSIVSDLTTTDGRAALLELLTGADVFVESWKPGVADAMGLGYDALHAANPSLVMCSVSTFGADGRHRDLDGAESLVHALVGTTGEQAGHRTPPIYEGLPFAGIGAGYLAVIGTLSALYRRIDDGIGRHVETSLLDGALVYLSMMWGNHDGSQGGGNPAAGTYRLITKAFQCADDEYIGVHTGAVGAFGRLMVELGLDDRVPPSETGMDIGVPLTPEQKQVLDENLDPIFRSRPRAEWIDRLRKADVCAIPHLRPTEVFDEPQAVHNGMSVLVDDAVLGAVRQVAPGVRFRGVDQPVPSPAPGVGADNGAVAWGDRSSSQGWSTYVSDEFTKRPMLDGVRIVDMGAYYAGPYSSRLLGDLGADVIKLETLGGDQVRGLERVFRSASANKRSISANLKDPDLEAAKRGLIEWADIIHHNMRPGAAERLGLGADDCAAIKPEIIYLYAPGWGSTGPDAMRQSFAPLMSGYVGVSYEVAGRYNEPMHPVGNEDPGNGLLGAVGMLLALYRRRTTGAGSYVENPQLNASMTHLSHIVRRPDGEVLGAARLDTLQLGVSVYDRLYETSDGWIAMGADSAARRAAFASVLGIDLSGGTGDVDDPAWFECEATIAARPTAEWMDEFAAADVPCVIPVDQPNNDTVMADPEYRRIGRVAEIAHPTQGHMRQIGLLIRTSHSSVAPQRYAPAIGEHSEEILAMVGYDAAKIAELRAKGSIR